MRSNDDGNIGFLSIENRVCVALSRAKNGFFMIGNMDCLAKNKLWQRLRNVLKQNDAIGAKLFYLLRMYFQTRNYSLTGNRNSLVNL